MCSCAIGGPYEFYYRDCLTFIVKLPPHPPAFQKNIFGGHVRAVYIHGGHVRGQFQASLCCTLALTGAEVTIKVKIGVEKETWPGRLQHRHCLHTPASDSTGTSQPQPLTASPPGGGRTQVHKEVDTSPQGGGRTQAQRGQPSHVKWPLVSPTSV